MSVSKSQPIRNKTNRKVVCMNGSSRAESRKPFPCKLNASCRFCMGSGSFPCSHFTCYDNRAYSIGTGKWQRQGRQRSTGKKGAPGHMTLLSPPHPPLTFLSFSIISSIRMSPFWETLPSIWVSHSQSSLFFSLKTAHSFSRSLTCCRLKETWER